MAPVLTTRQAQVAVLVGRGWTDPEIATELHVTPQRVGQIIAALGRKLKGPGKPRRRIREHLVAEATRRKG